MQFLVSVIANTPSWVWLVFALLIYRGILRSRSRAVSARSLIVMPIILTLLGIHRVYEAGFSITPLFGTLAGIVLGIGVVFFMRPARNTRRLDDGKIFVEGEWLSLVLFITIFGVNYVSAVLASINPAAASHDSLHFVLSFVSALSLSIMLARTVAHLAAGHRDAATHDYPVSLAG